MASQYGEGWNVSVIRLWYSANHNALDILHKQYCTSSVDPPKSVSVSISPSVEGDSVTLNCMTDSNPPAEIIWYKGGTFVGSGRIYSISKISTDDSGEYKCKSRNNHGQAIAMPHVSQEQRNKPHWILSEPQNLHMLFIESSQLV
uniref:Ig-like domain-containing protein n=1 Tax=Cyprinus carpio TaxID=7962 RepID=A0A8C2BQ33_CYPCA